MLIFGIFKTVNVKIDNQDKIIVNKYCNLSNMSFINNKLYEILNGFNTEPIYKQKMDLVQFNTAISNLLRICLNIKMTLGHGVIFGNGSYSSKYQITLAKFTMDMKQSSVEINKIN